VHIFIRGWVARTAYMVQKGSKLPKRVRVNAEIMLDIPFFEIKNTFFGRLFKHACIPASLGSHEETGRAVHNGTRS